jgi:ferredoxin--NADP+ reductase
VYRITEKHEIQPNVKMFKVYAPAVSRKAEPGQFVIIRSHERGERIPITIAGKDPDEGTVTIYFAEVGVSSKELGALGKGDTILNFSGPLGNMIAVEKYGEVLCVSGGVFQGANHYLSERLREAGNEVTNIICVPSENHLFLSHELKSVSKDVLTVIDDDANGVNLPELLENLFKETTFDRVYTFGPTSMQKLAAEATRPLGIPTRVNLFPIMVDGTGMCGACRVTVGGATRFACIDGPEFDGHQVDFAELISRMRYYTAQEKIAMVLQERRIV